MCRHSIIKAVIDVLDVNDNRPFFQQPGYKVSIKEDVPTNTSVLSVKVRENS